MKLYEMFKAIISKKDVSNEIPEGYCPNCWGRQEYNGKFYEAIQNEGMDINEFSARTGWIEAYAIEHLQGIKLQKDQDGDAICSSCKVKYQLKKK